MWAIKKTTPKYKYSEAGFTIVELLIVVVVIAILAAITIVSYNGIQNRANDTSVQADIRNLATKVQLYQADNGVYPGDTGDLATIDFKLNKNALATSPATAINFIYCNDNTTQATTFAIVAMSKSGKRFIVGDTVPLSEHTGPWGTGSSTVCTGVSPTLDDNFSGYSSTDTTTGPWRAWTHVAN